MKTIRLYGVLGNLFGREHKLEVQTPREAIHAMGILFPGFKKFLINSGYVYAVFVNKNNIGEKELEFKSAGTLRIAPIIAGSKAGGVLQTIIGASLIAASFIPGFQVLMPIGISMVLGGIVQMLSPQPHGLKQRQGDANAPSYAFGGAVNTSAAGNPVGLYYGKRLIGGAIVSAGNYTEDLQ